MFAFRSIAGLVVPVAALALMPVAAGLAETGLAGPVPLAPVPLADVGPTRAALVRAEAQGRAARARAARLEQEAARATAAADRTARHAAALAARIQQAEAGIDAAEARLFLINRQRAVLRTRLAERQRPVVELTAALQNLSRRPLALSLLQPGSVRDIVYLRAILATTLPEVAQRTAALREEIARGQALHREARGAMAGLRREERLLEQRRTHLVALETRQRLESRAKGGSAAREAERALALAEDARDLDTLIERLGQAGALRAQLAALPGPIIRPPRPERSQVMAQAPAPAETGARVPQYQLPVAGRIITGFGAPQSGGLRSRGITFAPRPRAQVVAPAAGRVVFAGPYRGYGRIAIVEHDGGWSSLVTGLARLDVAVAQPVVAGAPLGLAAPVDPAVTLELRRGAQPVNPLDQLR